MAGTGTGVTNKTAWNVRCALIDRLVGSSLQCDYIVSCRERVGGRLASLSLGYHILSPSNPNCKRYDSILPGILHCMTSYVRVTDAAVALHIFWTFFPLRSPKDLPLNGTVRSVGM